MAYVHSEWCFEGSTEHEFRYAGSVGAKGEKRAPKKKPTKAQMERQNQINRENRLRRVIKANFKENDIWTCCKYPKYDRPPVEEVKKDLASFRKLLSKAYKDLGHELKYVYRMEVGEFGGIHFHILVNRMADQQTDIILDQIWDRVMRNSVKRRKVKPPDHTRGLVDTKVLYATGGYRKLANYIAKRPQEGSEEYEQLKLFEEEDKKELLMIQTSRNLIRPEPVKKEYGHWTMRRLLRDGPKPKPGYYIDQDTIQIGVNPFTGWSYMKFTEVKIKEKCTSTSTPTAKLRI